VGQGKISEVYVMKLNSRMDDLESTLNNLEKENQRLKQSLKLALTIIKFHLSDPEGELEEIINDLS
jgi:hypothetical protein